MAAAALTQSKASYASTITYTNPVVAGHILIVCASGQAASDAISISDNQSNSWTKAVSRQQANGSGGYTSNVNSAIWYAVANGNNTPTITIANVTDPGGIALEYSGLTSTTNGTSSTSVAATANPIAANLVTTATDVIIAHCAQEQSSGTFSASGGGFTLVASNGPHIDGCSDAENVVAGTYACTFNTNISPTSPWIVLQAAFKTTDQPAKSNFLAFM